MDPKFPSSFWSDDDNMSLDSAHLLAYAWLKTNARRNNIGYQVVSKRKFTNETRLSEETLTSLLKTLPGHFVWDEESGTVRVWIRSFIAENWSCGQHSKNNNISQHLCGLIQELPERFREPLLASYQSLASLYQVSKNKQETTQSLPRDKSRAEQSRASSSFNLKGESIIPDDAEVMLFALRWPGEPASGTPQMPETYVLHWLGRMNARSGGWPLDWQRALVADWRANHRDFAKSASARPQGNAELPQNQKNRGQTPAQLRFKIDRELEAIRERLESAHATNLQPDPTDVARERELEAELKKIGGEK